MNLLIWLDLPLIVLALFTMAPRLWSALRRRQSACVPAMRRGTSTATLLLFYFGLGTLLTAGADVGLAQWEQARRSGSHAEIRVAMMAPDFALPSLDEDRTVRLSDFRGHKPVVLVFGNFY